MRRKTENRAANHEISSHCLIHQRKSKVHYYHSWNSDDDQRKRENEDKLIAHSNESCKDEKQLKWFQMPTPWYEASSFIPIKPRKKHFWYKHEVGKMTAVCTTASLKHNRSDEKDSIEKEIAKAYTYIFLSIRIYF